MKIKREYMYLILIFVFSLSLRLIFAFQTDGYSDSQAYFTLRQVEHITETGKPLFIDNLSYGGRTLLFNPLFHYILAFFNLFLPLGLVGKVIPNIFASTLIFLIYIIADELTHDKKVALFTSFVSSFIPIYFINTMNSVSPYSIMVPLMYLGIYFFLRAKKDYKYATHFIIILIIMSLTHASVIIFLFGLIIYYVLLRTDNKKLNRVEGEILIFSLFFVIWSQLIIYKKAFLQHGPFVVFQNIPFSILDQYFSNITLIITITSIGLIPFSYGIHAVYTYLRKERHYTSYLFLGFILSSGFLLWLKLIPVRIGIMMFGTFLLLMFSPYLERFFNFIRRTKISKYENLFFFLILIAFIITSFIPTGVLAHRVVINSYNEDELFSLSWIRDRTPEESVVLSSPEEGHLITQVAKRKNVIDINFLLIDSVNEVYEDVETIFKTKSETQALSLLEKYEVNYIYLSSRTKSFYGINKLPYYNEKCFDIVFKNSQVNVIKVLCRIKEI
jgi:hypothetical protein